MTADAFRKEALRLPEVEERSHMGHPDFRVNGKVFATLGYPDGAWGAVNVSPEHQRALVESDPHAFVVAKGAWGARGSTLVKLRTAKTAKVREALEFAWERRQAKGRSSKA
jgi:hypothetical protein